MVCEAIAPTLLGIGTVRDNFEDLHNQSVQALALWMDMHHVSPCRLYQDMLQMIDPAGRGPRAFGYL